MIIDHALYCFIYKRASYEAYKKYRINKLELWLLCALSAFLKHRNVTLISKCKFFEQITGNGREKFKTEGPLFGLQQKGFVGSYEYIKVPGSLSIGLSDLGVSVLICYDQAVRDFADKFAESPCRIGLPVSVTEEPISKYYKSKTV